MTALPVGPSEAERIAAELRAAGLCPDLTTKQIVYCLTAAWPLIVREVVEACVEVARDITRDVAPPFMDDAEQAYWEGLRDEQRSVLRRLRALVPPTGEGVTK